MDVEMLIDSVRAAPAICNPSDPKHNDRSFINDQWPMKPDVLACSLNRHSSWLASRTRSLAFTLNSPLSFPKMWFFKKITESRPKIGKISWIKSSQNSFLHIRMMFHKDRPYNKKKPIGVCWILGVKPETVPLISITVQ